MTKANQYDAFYTPRTVAEGLTNELFTTYLNNALPERIKLIHLDTIPTLPLRVLEPSVGSGVWLDCIKQHRPKANVTAIDADMPAIVNYGRRDPNANIMHGDYLNLEVPRQDLIIGNPPYSFAIHHVKKALSEARHVAFLLQLSFLGSQSRYEFFEKRPPTHVWVLSKRPSFTGGGTAAQEYGFFYWDTLRDPVYTTRLSWYL